MDKSTSTIKMQLERLRLCDREVAAMPKGRVKTLLRQLIGEQLEQFYQFQVESAKDQPRGA